jgi:hypothetical protein
MRENLKYGLMRRGRNFSALYSRLNVPKRKLDKHFSASFPRNRILMLYKYGNHLL